MKLPNITPGPWNGTREPVASLLFRSIQTKAGAHIAEIPADSTSIGISAHEMACNTVAIAAMPDVLEALYGSYRIMLAKEVLRLMESEKINQRQAWKKAHDVTPIKNARAALIKAGCTE